MEHPDPAISSIPGTGKEHFPPPKLPNPLWGPPGPVILGYQSVFPRKQCHRSRRLTIYLHLVFRFTILRFIMSFALASLGRGAEFSTQTN